MQQSSQSVGGDLFETLQKIVVETYSSQVWRGQQRQW